MNSRYTGIDGSLHMRFHISKKRRRRNDIRNVSSVPDSIAIALHLAFIPMRFAIELSHKIILVLSPGNARHEMNGISFIAPAFYTLFEISAGIIDAIHDGDISSYIIVLMPAIRYLESCFFPVGV